MKRMRIVRRLNRPSLASDASSPLVYLHLALAVVIGASCSALLALLLARPPLGTRAAPFARLLQTAITATTLITHTEVTTHRMSVFNDGRISNQFINVVGSDYLDQIDKDGQDPYATTLAIRFDQHITDTVDVGVQGEFVPLMPITLNTPSELPGYIEDTYAVYASRVLSYQVIQRTLAPPNANWVTLKLTVKNTGTSTLSGGKMCLMIDMDARQLENGDEGFYDNTRHMVGITDGVSGQAYCGMALSLLEGTWGGYGITGDAGAYPTTTIDTEIKAQMASPMNAVNDGGASNHVVWVVVNLPSLDGGASSTVSFMLGGACQYNAGDAGMQDKLIDDHDEQTTFSVAKSVTPAGGSNVLAGAPITYRVSIIREGPGTVDNVRFTDTVPTLTALLTYSTSQGIINAVDGTVTASLGSITSETPVYVTMVVASLISVTDGTSITNQAQVQGASAISPTRIVTSSKQTNKVVHYIINRPTITLTKWATPTLRVKAGERLTYTLALAAGHEGHVVDGVVSDSVPAHTQFVPGSIRLDPSAAGTGGTIPPTLTQGLTLRAGDHATITFAVTVTAPLTHGTIITNTAMVTAPHLLAAAEATITHTVMYTPVLRLYKTSYHPIIPLSYQDFITYTIVAHNQGNAGATGGVIRDLLAPHTQYVPNRLRLDAPDGGTAGNAPPVLAEDLTLSAGGLATITFAVTVTSPLSDGARITNTAALTSAEISVPVTATVVDIMGEAPELHIYKTSDRPFSLQPGNRILYTIVVSNVGDMDATGVLISDRIPTHTNFVSGTLSLQSPNGVVVKTGAVIQAHSLTIAVGSVVTVAFEVDLVPFLPDGTCITNTATVSSTEISTLTTASVTDVVEAAPVLHMRKISTYTEPLLPGSFITYTISISNSGNTDATGAVIVDPLPAYTHFVSDSLTLDPPTRGVTGTQPPVIVQDLTIGAGGGEVIVTFVVMVTAPLTDGTPIANTATLTSAEISAPTQATVTDTVSAAPLLALRKSSVYAPPLRPGDRVTYTIVARNDGNANATGAIIKDPLPAHTQFVVGSLALTPSDANGTLGAAPPNLVHDLTLRAGRAVTLTFAVTVTSPLTNGTSIMNTATLTSTEVSTPTQATVTDTVSAAPLLVLRKSSLYVLPLRPGGRVTYTIVAHNKGDANATGAIIKDPLPTHTQFVAGSLALTPSNAHGTLGAAPPNLVRDLTLRAGRAVTLTFAITVISPLTNGTSIMNTATLTSTEVSTPTQATVTDTVSAAPLLVLRKSSLYVLPLRPGGRVTYTIVAHNKGDANATGAIIKDPLPTHTQFVAGSLALTPSNAHGTLGAAPPNLVRDLTLRAGRAVTLTFAITVTASLTDDTLIANTATLTSTEVSTPTIAVVTDTVNVVPLLELCKSSIYDPPLRPGGRVTYIIMARNRSSVTATGVVINDPLPAHTQFIAGSLTLDPPDSGTLGNAPPNLVRDLVLAADGAATVTFAVTVTVPLTNDTSIANAATLTSTKVSASSVATVTDSVNAAPLLELHKSSAYVSPLRPGGHITYTIVAHNSGNANATGAIISDALPTHTRFIAGSLTLDPPDSGTLGAAPPRLVHDLTLAAAETVTVMFAVTVTSPLTDGTSIANVATLTSVEVSTPTMATVIDAVSSTAPLLELGKVSAYVTPLRPGCRITYTIVARNSGNADATRAVINDPLPAHTRFVAGSLTLNPSASGTLGTAPPHLVHDLTLAAAEVATVTFAVTVTSPLTDGTPIVNTATLTSAEASTPIMATVVDAVGAAPLLELRKSSAYTAPLQPGDRIMYTIVARNRGSASATGTIITDPLPAYTQFVAGSLTLDPPDSGALGTASPDLVRDLTLTAAGAATVTFAVTVTAPLSDVVDTFNITNTATLTSAELRVPLVATVVDTVSITAPPTLEDMALFPKQRTIQAGKRVTYTVLATDSLGYQWDATSEATFAIEASAGGMWMANTYMSQVSGIWTVTATLQHLSDMAILEVEAPIVHILYLPIVTKHHVSAPDLSIKALVATQTHITVVVQNLGNMPVVNNFWVDVYVDPDPIPSGPNDIWPDFADQGLAWGITEDLLPGATFTLTEGNAIPWVTYTLITWPLRIGIPIYAQVDSAYVGQSYGAVLENHEILGGPYNNFAGPVNVEAVALPYVQIPMAYRGTETRPFWKLKGQLPER